MIDFTWWTERCVMDGWDLGKPAWFCVAPSDTGFLHSSRTSISSRGKFLPSSSPKNCRRYVLEAHGRRRMWDMIGDTLITSPRSCDSQRRIKTGAAISLEKLAIPFRCMNPYGIQYEQHGQHRDMTQMLVTFSRRNTD